MAKTTGTKKKQNYAKSLDRLFNSSPAEWKVSATRHGLELTNIGPINKISLPPDWQLRTERYNRPGQSSLQQYCPSGDPSVSLLFYYRGLPCDKETAGKFKETLAGPLHLLSSDECCQLRALLRGKENKQEFELLNFQSMELNGNHILLLTGIYIEDQKPMMCLYLDVDGTGAVVQEIEYQAPLDRYAIYLPQIEESIQSICWK